jgi:hypothetical protein
MFREFSRLQKNQIVSGTLLLITFRKDTPFYNTIVFSIQILNMM